MPRILKTPWTSQPQVPVGIDWNNPITRGLVVAVNGATLIDHVSGKPLTIANNNGLVVSSKGLSANFNNSMYGSIPISWSGGPFTLFAVGNCSSDIDLDVYCSVGDSGSSANDIVLYRALANDCSYLFSRTSGSYVQTTQVDNSNLVNTFYTLAGVTHSSTDRRIYRDGVQLGNVTTSLTIASSINTFYYGAQRTSGAVAGQFSGAIPVAMLFNRALSAEEVKRLSDNPWQIFAPANRPLYFDLGASGAYTSPADPGSINIYGVDSTDIRSLLSATNTGSFALTGFDATSTRSKISATDVGQIALTGINATSLRQLLSATNTGSLSITGYDATSTEAAAGATVSSADPGSFDILGYTATSIRALLSSGEAGAYSITGFDSTASKSILSATDVGSLALTGFDVSTLRTFVSTTDTGQIVLTGYDATSSSVVPDVGRPSSDVSGTWLASTGSDKFAMVDESVMDNSDYIYTNTVGAVQRMTLNAMSDLSSQGQVFSYSVWSPTGHGITVRLLNRSDDSVIAEWAHPGPLSTTAPATENDATHQTLTPSQIAAIIDYAAIDLEVEATA